MWHSVCVCLASKLVSGFSTCGTVDKRSLGLQERNRIKHTEEGNTLVSWHAECAGMVVVVSFDLRHIVVWTFTRAVASSSTYFSDATSSVGDAAVLVLVVPIAAAAALLLLLLSWSRFHSSLL